MDATFRITDRPRAVDTTESAVFDGEVVVFDAATSMVHRLPYVTGAVWTCCDGDTPVAEMIDEIADSFGDDRHVVERAVFEGLSALAAAHLLVGFDDQSRSAATVEARAGDGRRVVVSPFGDP